MLLIKKLQSFDTYIIIYERMCSHHFLPIVEGAHSSWNVIVLARAGAWT